MKRPFVTLCIFLFIGIIYAYFFQYLIPIHYVLYSAIVSLGILVIHEKRFVNSLLLTVFILGAYLYGHGIVGNILLESAPSDIRMSAKVLKEGLAKNGYSEYEIEILNLFNEETNKFIEVNRNAQLKVYQHPKSEFILMLNDTIEINNAKITKLLRTMNRQKQNRYDLLLKSKGIEYILEVSSEDIKYNNDTHGKATVLRLTSYKTKVYLEDFLDSTLDFENSDILKSIMFGNQGYLSRDKLNIYSKTGTAHIMAVSGLHVGLIVLIVDKFLKFAKVRRNRRLCCTVVILTFYSYMVYFPVSIVRAGIMYILHVISYFLHRRYDSINALFFIAFILLIYRPMSAFSISFQLSFIATLSILLLSPILNKILIKRIGFISTLLSVTLAAQIGTLPIMAYYFRQISVISLVTNLLIVPLLLPTLSIAFVSILVGVISFRVGFLVNQITNHLLNYINWISTKCAIIPYGSFEVSEVKMIYILIYYISLAIIYLTYKHTENNKKQNSNLKKEGLVKIYEL